MHKVILTIALAILMLAPGANAGEKNLATSEKAIFIQIDDLTITGDEFEGIFREAVRHKYYHGQVPENELNEFKKRVAKDLVTQIIVYRDAQNKGIKPDNKQIAEGVKAYDLKYANSPGWQQMSKRVIPQLTRRLERQDLLEKMEAKIKNIPEPQVEQAAEYYRKHPQKFTEPRRVWGSVILLQVPPSSDETMWFEATDAAAQLKFQIENGEDFAGLAKQFSGHVSAVNGGDLGYIHQGMLEANVQEKVEALAINQVSDPIRVLEGILLFRLNGIQAGKLRPFDEVEQRAVGLLHRELQDQAWEMYVADLKASAKIQISNKLYVQNNNE